MSPADSLTTGWWCLTAAGAAEPPGEEFALWNVVLAGELGEAFGGLAWQSDSGLSAWMASDAEPGRALRALESATGLFEREWVATDAGSVEDWTRAWREGFEPVEVAGFRIVPTWRASGHCAPRGNGPGEIVIEPTLAFGTGQHESTRLALRAMAGCWEANAARYAAAAPRVLDVGSGSAILAIAAWQLGAATPIAATEIDPQALSNARENIAANGLAAGDIDYRIGGTVADFGDGEFDLILCNMLSQEFVPLLSEFRRLLAPGGGLVLSGFLAEEEPRLAGEFAAQAFPPAIRRHGENDWVSWVVIRN